MSVGLILFGHGARDARWREPFERLRRLVAEGHDGPVTLAFLEHMEPDLLTAAQTLAQGGVDSIVVVPLFLGTGGHIRRDLPVMIDAARRASGLSVEAVPPAGEDDGVLAALARYCLESALRPRAP